MHTLESELRELHREGFIDAATAARAIAVESRTLFTLFEELRLALYASVAAIITGLGILLKKNFDHIGHLTLMLALAATAAGCYAAGVRLRRGGPNSVASAYVVLLGALLISADLGYAETEFHWLGSDWARHLLLLAIVHGLTAYLFESPLVMSLSLASLAGWIGVDAAAPAAGDRALACAALLLVWREIHRRLHGSTALQDVLEHFTANLGFWGALAWCAGSTRPLEGSVIVVVLATVLIRTGLRSQRAAFVAYGVVYAALAACILEGKLPVGAQLVVLLMLTTVVGAVTVLWNLHGRLRADS
jgi:Predicted membrane protein (DUF2157)